MTITKQKQFLDEYYELNEKIKKLKKELDGKKKELKTINFKWKKKDDKNEECIVGAYRIIKNERVRAKKDEEVQTILEEKGLWNSLKKTVEVLDEMELQEQIASEKLDAKILDELVNKSYVYSVKEKDKKETRKKK